MTYIIPDALALRLEYERSLKRSGRKPARMETQNYQTHPRRQTAPAALVRAMIQSPMAGTYRDPRLGTGNAGQSTQYMAGMGELGDAAEDIMSNMAEQVKKKLVEQAAINAGISAGLAISGAYTLGIGTVLAGVYALITSLLGAKYRRQSDELIADLQNDIKVKQAAGEAAITANDQKIMNEQMPAAKALALSGVPLGGLGNVFDVASGYISDLFHDPARTIKVAVMRPVKAAQTVVSQVVPAKVLDVYKSVMQPVEDTGNRIYNAAEDARDTVSGRAAYTKAENAVNNARPAAYKIIDDNTAAIIADHNGTKFRNEITIQMAKQIRQDPNVTALVNSTNATVAAPNVSVSLPPKSLSFAPMAGAAAAVLAFGFLKG